MTTSYYTIAVTATEQQDTSTQSHEILFSYITPMGQLPRMYHIDTGVDVTRDGWSTLAQTLSAMADVCKQEAEK